MTTNTGFTVNGHDTEFAVQVQQMKQDLCVGRVDNKNDKTVGRAEERGIFVGIDETENLFKVPRFLKSCSELLQSTEYRE